MDQMFQAANMLAIVGWIFLVISPWVPKLANLIAKFVIPLILSVAYTGVVLAFWSSNEGGFGSLPEVMLLFSQKGAVMAGWLHYLAFDLFVGAWEVRTARSAGIRHWLVLPCLVLTFLFGPAGLLLFAIIWAVHNKRKPVASN